MRFRACMIVCFLLLFACDALAKRPSNLCGRVKSEPDAWVTAKVDALVTAARAAYEDDEALPAYQRVLDGITATIRQCKLSEDKGFVDRHRVFAEYIEVTSLDRRPDHELGFNIPDKQYFAGNRKYLQIPEFLLTPGFLKSASRYETLDKAKSFLRLLNSTRDTAEQLVFFSYTSRHLGTPDNDDSYRRLLIVVPGNVELGTPEKWVQFGVTDPGKRVRVRNVSVVSAIVGKDGTFNAYFKDYYRTFRRDGSIAVKGRWELGQGDDNCVTCHKSGILPIFPVEGSVSPSEQQALLAVNQRFLRYGSPRFDKYLDQTKFGPGLSSASLEDRAHRFGEDFGETTYVIPSVARVLSTSPMPRSVRMALGGKVKETNTAAILEAEIEGLDLTHYPEKFVEF